MEGKIIMYDAEGTEVGVTYSRRARQLVKQQRAVWADDTHTAIRFTPDAADEWELEPATTAPHSAPDARKSSILYALAEKRIHDRRRIIWHSVALIPVFILIFLWGLTSYHARRGGEMFILFMGFGWGVWLTAYVAHLRNYVKSNNFAGLGGWEARRKLQLEAEVDRLRRMGYTE